MFDLEKIEVISFDCYGTLIDWETGILNFFRPFFKKSTKIVSDEEILQQYAHFESSAQKGEYRSYREVLAEVMKEMAQYYLFGTENLSENSLAESLKQWLPFSETTTCLQRLGQKYKLAVISNIDDDLFLHSQKLLGVNFSYVITAEAVRSYKPSLDNFHFALKQMGITKEKILHVAQSRYHDLAPAKELGIKNVWVNRNKYKNRSGATNEVRLIPDKEITDLVELTDLAGVSGEIPELTRSAGAVVLNDESQVLIVSQHGTSWSLPKGHIDPGEDNLTAAIRETYEEAGINPENLSYVRELGSYQRYRISGSGEEDRSELKTIFIYLFTTSQKELKPIDPENPEARWVERETALELLTHPADQDFFRSLINLF